MSRYDVVVIGGGPAGERAAVQAARAGKRAALVEAARVVGGTCINWGAIPSKTLRESALFWRSLTQNRLHGIQVQVPARLTMADFLWREKLVVQRELELINEGIARHRIEVFHGRGRLVDAHTVAVLGADGQSRTRLQADILALATGSSPHRPPDVSFDGQSVFDSDTILVMPRIPQSLLVLGAGVIGLEYAAMFAALGVEVTLVDTRPALLPFLDREIAGILERELRALGVVVLHDDHYATIEVTPGTQGGTCGEGAAGRVRCHTRQGNLLEAEALLYAVGRSGNTADLGLDSVGLAPSARGLIEVNEHFQTAVPNIYAVGDVIGYPALASTSMEQGRQAMRHAFGLSGPQGSAEVLPFAIYTIPEVGTIGESEEAVRSRGEVPLVGRAEYRQNPRGQIAGDLGGLLKLVFATGTLRLLGVHLVGTSASELVHIGQAFLRQGATATVIAETLYNYPTLSDLYRHASLDALRQDRLQREGRDDLAP